MVYRPGSYDRPGTGVVEHRALDTWISMTTEAVNWPLGLTVACTQSVASSAGVPYVRQSRKTGWEGSDSDQ